MRSLLKLSISPIIPLALVLYLLYKDYFNNQGLLIISIFLSIFILLKFINKLKNEILRHIQIVLVSIDWFMIDIINLFSNNEYKFLYSSLAETVAKNAIYAL